MINKFANLTRGEIARKFISPERRNLFEEFFGRGLQGAKNRSKNFIVPKTLTAESLEAYAEIARRTIEEKLDKKGVQALRLQLVEKALAELER